MKKCQYIKAEFEVVGLRNVNIICTSATNESYEEEEFDWGDREDGATNESYEDEEFNWNN